MLNDTELLSPNHTLWWWAFNFLMLLSTVRVLGPRAHYPRLYWAQNPSQGLGIVREGGNVIMGTHVSERPSQSGS